MDYWIIIVALVALGIGLRVGVHLGEAKARHQREKTETMALLGVVRPPEGK